MLFELCNKNFRDKFNRLEPGSKNFWKITKATPNVYPPLVKPIITAWVTPDLKLIHNLLFFHNTRKLHKKPNIKYIEETIAT